MKQLEPAAAGLLRRQQRRSGAERSCWLTFSRPYLAAGYTEPAYREAVDMYRPQLQPLYAQCFQKNGIDALFFAATPITAPLIGVESV